MVGVTTSHRVRIAPLTVSEFHPTDGLAAVSVRLKRNAAVVQDRFTPAGDGHQRQLMSWPLCYALGELRGKCCPRESVRVRMSCKQVSVDHPFKP